MMTTLRTSSATAAGLRVENVSYAYAGRQVFRNLSFEVPRGSTHALVGRSGIGKTTLLNIVLGLYRPLGGKVWAGDLEITAPGNIRGVVFREDSLLGWLDVTENILFPNHREPDPAHKERTMDLIRRIGLVDAARKLPRQLSAGMGKRVEVLRALLADDAYFIGDEPFSSLDVVTRSVLHRLWWELLLDYPRTSLICTHDPFEAARLAQVILVMRDSRDGEVVIEPIKVPARFHEVDVPDDKIQDPFLGQVASLMGAK